MTKGNRAFQQFPAPALLEELTFQKGAMAAMASVAGVFLKPKVPGQYGLPKLALPEAEIVPAGVRGDFNNYRQEELHGDPDSAVLLITEDIADALRSEGWPIRPGDLGENLLVRGLAYKELAPPREVRIGRSLRLTTTRACDPCHRLATLPYVGDQREAAFLRTTLHRRGWYARVLRPGHVRVGDPVELV